METLNIERTKFWLYVIENDGAETLVGVYETEEELLEEMDTYSLDVELMAYIK